MKITITRALAELKTLKLRYTTELNSATLIAVSHGAKLRRPYSQFTKEDFEKRAKACYQSIEALRNRITRIKEEIDKSNSTTIVNIAGKEMTVQQAIVRKNLIPFWEDELRVMKSQYAKAQNETEAAITENRARVETIVRDQNSPGKAADTKATEKSALETIDAFYAISFVDPLGLKDKIDALEKEISDFKTNVDYVLSESNSTTLIEIED